MNALLKIAQELQELAKTPWIRDQSIRQVSWVQDGCDHTPNEEEDGTSLEAMNWRRKERGQGAP